MRISDWSSDVCSSDLRRKLEPLRAFAFHLGRDLLHVEHDVGNVFTHTGQAREFVEHIPDLDRRDGRTLERREQHTAQRVAERQAEAALERFGDEGRLRSEEHTSELKSLMRNSYAVFRLKKKNSTTKYRS